MSGNEQHMQGRESLSEKMAENLSGQGLFHLSHFNVMAYDNILKKIFNLIKWFLQRFLF